MNVTHTLTKRVVFGSVAALAFALVWTQVAAQSPTGLLSSPVQIQATQSVASVGPAITLDEALARARANEPIFAAELAASRTAALDRSIARSALLPSVIYHNQYLYTQPNGSHSGVSFVANNGVHEYVSQALVNETIGLAQLTAVSRASADAAIASAELEISRRGLNATVAQLFYGVTTSQTKVAVEQRATREAQDFVKQTQLREDAREAAHADVMKAQLTLQQSERDLGDALLQADKARLELGVLLFVDPRSPYTVISPTATSLVDRSAIEAAANTNNAELKSALGTLRSRNLGITQAKAAYLPDLGLNFTYGIDAPEFAIYGSDGARNLGYSASATLDIPVWDWFTTAHRVKQAQILRDAAKVVLSSSQRRLIAQLDEFYAEAELAHRQLDSLDTSVTTAVESLRLTRLRYTSGEATVLEVVDAQNSLTQAELSRADGATRYQLSLANLQLLTGTI